MEKQTKPWIEIQATESDNGLRLDKFLVAHTDFTRTYIQNLVEQSHVLVDDQVKNCNFKLKGSEVVKYFDFEPVKLELNPEPMNLDIIYEDDDIAIVNKPKNVSVHPTESITSGTLVNGLLSQLSSLSGINGIMRPGIVHRIDKDTTGLLMIAKNDHAHEFLSKQLRDHTVNRTYQALVYGKIMNEAGRIEAPVGRDPKDRKKMGVVESGKDAITNFKVLERFQDFTLIECKLETGRTHQIRVHLAYIDHPVVGDPLYGPRKVIGDQGQFLHAKTIGFIHPTTGKYMEFHSELPEYFSDFLEELRKKEQELLNYNS